MRGGLQQDGEWPRPNIGTRCRHAGRIGEVRATYSVAGVVHVVGRYRQLTGWLRPQGPGDIFTAPWSECEPLGVAA